MKTKQILNMEGTTLMTLHDSRFYNVDREHESLPQQSLVQSTDVYYGERPDLMRKFGFLWLKAINNWIFNYHDKNTTVLVGRP